MPVAKLIVGAMRQQRATRTVTRYSLRAFRQLFLPEPAIKGRRYPSLVDRLSRVQEDSANDQPKRR